jgi:hypothetical protein
MMLSIMIQMAPLTERSQVKQTAIAMCHVIQVRNGQHYLASGDRMWLIIFRSTPFAAISSAIKTHKSAAQFPVRRVGIVVDWH